MDERDQVVYGSASSSLLDVIGAGPITDPLLLGHPG
jgi:hypothetical protein